MEISSTLWHCFWGIGQPETKRWTAKHKSALVLEIIQGKTTMAETSRAYDLSLSEIEAWVEEAKASMDNALRAKPRDVRERYGRRLKELQEAYSKAMLELRARKKLDEEEQYTHRYRFESTQHLSRVISDWIHFYNHKRPHQALQMKTCTSLCASGVR